MDFEQKYFEWMVDLVCKGRYGKDVSYRKLLNQLNHIEFYALIRNDQNRAEDGISLRRRFSLRAYDEDISDVMDCPCSVLEMLVALAIRCEESIMANPDFGDRTGQWFWGMIGNLGLGGLDDSHYDEQYVEDTVVRFLEREYAPDGAGGLFRIKNCEHDLRDVEIWYQMCWYLDNIIW